MCTLHLFYRIFPEAPVLFAANRDEHLDRAWREPGSLSSLPRIFGPRDLTGGGTWLGVNEVGVLASLANHEGTLSNGGGLCSRGTVVLEALRHATAAEARAFAEWVAPACKAYTLLLADPEAAFVVDHGTDGTQTYRLLPGRHVITNARFRDPEDPKARRSLQRMAPLTESGRLPTPEELAAFLSDHERAAPETTPLCIHPGLEGFPERFGTSSASVVRVSPARSVDAFLFASGPPCTTAFEDVTPEFVIRDS